jgi:hypothetical protein
MISKKGQIWGLDLIIALIIFIIGLASFFFFYLNYSSDMSDNYQSLTFDGNAIADSILSEGSPQNWNSSNVVSIGILSGNEINNTKLGNFQYMAVHDYQSTKAIFNTKYDYFFFLEFNLSIGNSSVIGIGKPGVNPSAINAANLIKINRITVINSKPVGAYVYVWEN